MATPITSVAGVGAQTAEILTEHGFDSAEALAAAEESDLVKISGFGPAKAHKFIEAARTLLADDGGSIENEKPEEQGAAGVENGIVGRDDGPKQQSAEKEEKPVDGGSKNPCTQKLCKKKKKIKKVRVKVKKKKKKGSSRKKRTR